MMAKMICKSVKTFLFIVFLLSLSAACSGSTAKNIALENAIQIAFFEKKEASKEQEIVFMLYDIEIDHLEIAPDGKTAEIWFALLEPGTNEVLATEPGVALAYLVSDDPYSPASWQIILHHEIEWSDALWGMPDSLMSLDQKQLLAGKTQSIPHDAQRFQGYKLPWPEGKKVKLSGSIAHVFIYKTCPSTCLYAFDFWDGTMFPVSAARSGTVKTAVWEYPNGNTTHTNYLLLEDKTTNPTTYQIYYHLAQDSIPPALRKPGAVVNQGDFIGNADDTGASTAHHLHFMVHTNPNSYWGSSVDITFDEVNINGGRPRTCKESSLYPEHGSECITGDWFTSQNSASPPPTINMLYPTANSNITEQKVMTAAQASGSSPIQTINFFFRQNTQNWQIFNSFYGSNIAAADLDFCYWGLPDGAIELAVEAVDLNEKKSDNKANPIVINKAFICPTTPAPECEPGPDQIALFTDLFYQGTCAVLSVGEYPGLETIQGIGNDRVRSILIGNDALAILYVNTNLKGTQETFTTSDPDLRDNSIGIDTVSSVKIMNFPDSPTFLTLSPLWIVSESDTIRLEWQSDAESFRAELSHENEIIQVLDWTQEKQWTIGSLPGGIYSLRVIGRNISGEIEAESTLNVEKQSKLQPITQLQQLSTITRANLVRLSWTVLQADENVSAFQLEMKEKDHDWFSLAEAFPPEQRTIDIIGNAGSTYQFRLRAIANEGESENWSINNQTQTTLQQDCIPDLYDTSPTGDDTPENAVQAVWFETQEHNVCGPADQDWIVFTATNNQKVIFDLESLLPGLDMVGLVFLAPDFDHPVYQFSGKQTWEAFTAGTYALKIQAIQPLIAGTDARYLFTLKPAGVSNNGPIICFPLLAILAAMTGVAYKKGFQPKNTFQSFLDKIKKKQITPGKS